MYVDVAIETYRKRADSQWQMEYCYLTGIALNSKWDINLFKNPQMVVPLLN